jgi:hypothetical protein
VGTVIGADVARGRRSDFRPAEPSGRTGRADRSSPSSRRDIDDSGVDLRLVDLRLCKGLVNSIGADGAFL